MVPSIFELASGCAFRDRCQYAMPVCAEQVPPMLGVVSAVANRLTRLRGTLHADETAAQGVTLGGAADSDLHGAACWLHAKPEEGSR